MPRQTVHKPPREPPCNFGQGRGGLRKNSCDESNFPVNSRCSSLKFATSRPCLIPILSPPAPRTSRRTQPLARLGLGSPGKASVEKAPPVAPVLRASGDREVRVGPLLPVGDALASRGVPLAEVLLEAGAPVDVFSDPDNRVDDVLACRLLANAAQRLSLPHLGLLVGRPSPVHAIGPVGELLSYCQSLGSALRALLTHLSFSDRAASPIMLELGPRSVILGYMLYRHIEAPIRPALDVAISIAFSILERLCGPAWRPLEVRLAYAAPDDLRPYEEAFGCHVCFDAELSGVVFPAALLDLPLPGADPERHAELEAQIRQARTQVGMSFTQQVKAVLPQAILGACSSESEVASLFAMHERTLRRRLLGEGEHFHRLLADARRELATQLLANTRLSVSDIARALGYGDPNVFSRAFRGWTGASPTAWRVRLDDPSAAP